MKPRITWLGHASLLISTEKVIAVDPWKTHRNQVADIVLITHSHHDHCSDEDVKKIIKVGGTVIGTPDALKQISAENKIPIAPGQTQDLGWVKVEAVPAYNTNKGFHPKTNNWVGFILRFEEGFPKHSPQVHAGEGSIYIAGDTDLIPEMDAIKVDTAILPVGGIYTMTAVEAAEATRRIGPKVVIPVHYGDIVGDKNDAEVFAEKVVGTQVQILEPEQ